MLNCREATRLLSESQERVLNLKEKMALKAHTIICSGCRNFEKHMDALRKTAKTFAKGVNEEKPE